MKTPKKTSPARSQGTLRTPKRKLRRTLSVASARSNGSGRLTAVIQQHRLMDSFVLSPLVGRQSILSDNTEIEEPKRKSWWRNLNDNSRDVTEVLEENNRVDPNNIIEELDIEILSQEKKDYTMDLPESSDSESIHSIVIPQRKLLTLKEKQPQKMFGEIIGNRETLTKLHKPNATRTDKVINAGTRELFQNRQRSKPIFPAALLNISLNKTAADNTFEPKARVRNIFGNRAATKRKNIFTNFIASESEDEIPEIQPKVFGFQRMSEVRRRGSSSSHGVREPSPASSMTADIEMDDWKMLPSSTMVENQLEIMMAEGQSPKRARLSKLIEDKESEVGASKHSSKSTVSKDTSKPRKSKTFTKEKSPETEKNRKSKTFTKEKSPVVDSRKSKTFTKEKADFDFSANKSEPSDDEDEIFDRNQVVQNKSKNKTMDRNVSQLSIKTSSQDKNKSPNSSKAVAEDLMNIDLNVNKQVASEDRTLVADQENFDDELNFTLKYDDENDEQEKKPKIKTTSIKSKSMSQKDNCTANISKSNRSLLRRSNKVIDESADLETTQDNDHALKPNNKSEDKETTKINEIQMETNEECHEDIGTDQPDDVPDNSGLNNNQDFQKQSIAKKGYENNDDIELENNEQSEAENKSAVNQTEEKQILENYNENVDFEEQNESTAVQDQEEIESPSKNVAEHDEVGNDYSQETEDNELNENQEVENEDEQNDSQEVEIEERHDEIQEVGNEDEENESREVEIENEDEQNESTEKDDESQEDENEDGHDESQEVEQNESQEVVNEDGQNESQEEENDDGHDESQEVENEDEQNESQEVESEEENVSQELEEETEGDDRVMSDMSQEEIIQQSDIERNNEENEQVDSDAIDSDNDNEPSHAQNNGNESQNRSASLEQFDETPNLSHDTTGRNRKKDITPEVILHKSNNNLDSFTVQGRNTSVRKTDMIKSLHIKRSLTPLRESIGLSDGTKNSTAEGSGWDSHRTTRKTLRQTFGKDFTPRKSLRALVMEKSAKRQTAINDAASVTHKFPQANSTTLPDMSNRFDDVDENEATNLEVSLRTRQTTLEKYLQENVTKNTKTRLKIEEAVLSSLNAPSEEHIFKVPAKPMFPRRNTQAKPPVKSTYLGELPPEVIEDLKYKPPKRFRPSNAAWITKRLYKYLETKLEPKYDYKARMRAEKLVEDLYHFAKDVRRRDVAAPDAVDVLKREMARLGIVHTHSDFHIFLEDFMPREVRVKVIPDNVNKISLSRNRIFSEIL